MVNMNDLTEKMIEELAFSKADLEELALARTMPITFDEDCPETTPERAIKFRRVNPSAGHPTPDGHKVQNNITTVCNYNAKNSSGEYYETKTFSRR